MGKKRDPDLPSLEESASMAFLATALGKLDDVANIAATVPRRLSRELDARYRLRYDKLMLAAHRWAIVRIRAELWLTASQLDTERLGAEAVAEAALVIESHLLSIEAGLDDAAREHSFAAEAVRVMTQLPRFTASRTDATIKDAERLNAAELIHDVMKR